jgi:purine-binding chemotaxis protein CheW
MATETADPIAGLDGHALVTMTVSEHLFGVPISRVEDVFVVQAITPVPLAPPEIVGLLNLRGKVVTALSLRARLGLPKGETGTARPMAIGIERAGEAYGLVVDAVGDVITVDATRREALPGRLQQRWGKLATGIYQLETGLLVELDPDALIRLDAEAIAA